MKKSFPPPDLEAFVRARLPRQADRILDSVQLRVEQGESLEDATAVEYLAAAQRIPLTQIRRDITNYDRRHPAGQHPTRGATNHGTTTTQPATQRPTGVK